METLKLFENLCTPDVRQSFFRVTNSATGEVSLLRHEDIYDSAASIRLHAGVPEDVASHFSAALNLLAYSWYHYPFNGAAQFMAYVSVEYSLKVRFPSDKRQNFASLLRRSVSEGLVKDNGFSHCKAHIPGIGEVHVVPPMFVPAEGPYVEALVKLMPGLRNNLAHGVTNIHMQGPQSVRICAELINQLFPVPPNAG